MDFGVPKEVRDLESRVGLSPAGVFALASAGHAVYIETGAGTGAGFSDENYRDAGGTIVYSAQDGSSQKNQREKQEAASRSGGHAFPLSRKQEIHFRILQP